MATSKAEHYDVIIVGAGMVGATLGCALSAIKMKTLLIDYEKPEAYSAKKLPDLRVSALNIASANIMHNLDVWSLLTKKRLCSFKVMRIWEELREGFPLLDMLPLNNSDSRINETTFDCKYINQSALGYIIENRLLQLSLHQKLAQTEYATLATNIAISSFDSMPESSVKILTLSDGKRCSTPLIVGADGSSSKVRQWAGFGVTRKEYEQQALVATVEIDKGPLDQAWQAFVKTGPMALLPLPDCNGKHYASLVWYHQSDDVKRLMALSDPAFISELTDCFPQELPEIITLCERGFFPLAKQLAQQYAGEGVVLVGDAAHTVNPLAGQGVNLGLMDVAVLADILGQSFKTGGCFAAKDHLLVYERKRKSDNNNMAFILDAFYHGFSNDVLPLKLIRNLGLSVMNKLRPVSGYIEKYGAGLHGNLPPLAQNILTD